VKFKYKVKNAFVSYKKTNFKHGLPQNKILAALLHRIITLIWCYVVVWCAI